MFTMENCIMFTMEYYRRIACDLCQEVKKKIYTAKFVTELCNVYYCP
jgi:hypothetical protein